MSSETARRANAVILLGLSQGRRRLGQLKRSAGGVADQGGEAWLQGKTQGFRGIGSCFGRLRVLANQGTLALAGETCPVQPRAANAERR
jgi:hypothetical protein